jgi:DNA-binding GntR family transcriptional regulator
VSASPLSRVSTVDTLADELRTRILDGALPAGTWLRERELTGAHGVARHTLRAALRVLAGEGLVRLEPHRGARVAQLSAEEIAGLYELRTALELEAAHLALARHDGRLPESVHLALDRLVVACRREPEASWREVTDAHDALHGALVAAGGSERIARAHAALRAETRLFLLQLREIWTPERMAADHERLVADLEATGPAALREHLRQAAAALGATQ